MLLINNIILTSLGIALAVNIAAAKPRSQSAVLNINKASIQQLQTIKGIGLRRAQAIVSYREQNGRFNQLADMAKVKGVPASFVKQHQADLRLR